MVYVQCMMDEAKPRERSTRISWRTLWGAVGVVVVLGLLAWMTPRAIRSEQEGIPPPPSDSLEGAPAPDNRETELPPVLPEPEEG